MKIVVFAFLTVLFISLLAGVGGCKRADSQANPQTIAKRNVVCVGYPEADIARQVAGDQADVRWQIDWFCDNGQDPRDLEMTDDRRQLIRQADLMISSGFSEPWLGSTLTEEDRSHRLIALDSLESAKRQSKSDFHGALWLDPQIAIELTDVIREHMAILDGRYEDQYHQQAAAYQQQLRDFDADCARELAPFKRQAFLALRPTWAPFAARYGLQEIAPVSTSPQKLTDDQVHQLQDAAVRYRTNFLAVESSLLPGVKREVQMRTGLTLIELDSVGTSASEGRSTYIRLMRYNLLQLSQALQ